MFSFRYLHWSFPCRRLKAFLEGFYDIIPKRLISIFNEQELELLISGLPNVDIEDLKSNTEYHKYQPNSLQVCCYSYIVVFCWWILCLIVICCCSYLDPVVLAGTSLFRSSRPCQVPPVRDGHIESAITRIRCTRRNEWNTEIPDSPWR